MQKLFSFLITVLMFFAVPLQDIPAESVDKTDLSPKLKAGIKKVSKNFNRIVQVFPVKGHMFTGKCNGFFWNSQNVVTNAHCLTEGEEFVVKDIEGNYFDVKTVVAHIEWRDIVVLRLKKRKWGLKSLYATTRNPDRGDIVFTFINTDKHNYKGWKLRMGKYLHPYNSPEKGSILVAKLNVRKGDSGSPVFNARGTLIGVLSSGGNGEAEFLPIVEIKKDIKKGVRRKKIISMGRWMKDWKESPERQYFFAKINYLDKDKPEYQKARIYFLKALGIVEEDLDAEPVYPTLWYHLGLLNVNARNFDRAHICFTNAEAILYDNIFIDYELALYNHKKGVENYNAKKKSSEYLKFLNYAETKFKKVLNKEKSYVSSRFAGFWPGAHYDLGVIYLIKQNRDKALLHLKALEKYNEKYAKDLSDMIEKSKKARSASQKKK